MVAAVGEVGVFGGLYLFVHVFPLAVFKTATAHMTVTRSNIMISVVRTATTVTNVLSPAAER